MTFADPWGDVFEERNADSFVDDTSLGCNDAHLEKANPLCGTDCEGTGMCSDLGTNSVQLGRST
jgi:hypothetical protein